MSGSWLRTLHRDLGFLAFGLTVVYAVSGVAVNHIGTWDPNFVREERTAELGPQTGQPSAVAAVAMERLGLSPATWSVDVVDDTRIDIKFKDGQASVNPKTGRAVARTDRARPVLRSMNWLHLNRGKGGWTWIADGYAVILGILAISGLCIAPVRRQLAGRGGVFLAIGIALPVGWVLLFGP